MRRWPERYGFAFLVVVAIACGSFLAGSVEIPEPVPTFALQAKVDDQTRAMLNEFDRDLKVIVAELNSCRRRLEMLETKR